MPELISKSVPRMFAVGSRPRRITARVHNRVFSKAFAKLGARSSARFGVTCRQQDFTAEADTDQASILRYLIRRTYAIGPWHTIRRWQAWYQGRVMALGHVSELLIKGSGPLAEGLRSRP